MFFTFFSYLITDIVNNQSGGEGGRERVPNKPCEEGRVGKNKKITSRMDVYWNSRIGGTGIDKMGEKNCKV